MTFAKFEELVKNKYPKAEVFSHGEFAGNKINVAIVFSPASRVYRYNGTYCEVLNRLGIKTIYKHDLDDARKILARYIREDGEKDLWFGGVHNYTKKIEEWAARVADYENNYVVV